MAIPSDTALVANGLVKRLTQDNAHVLNHVVRVNLEVAGGLDMNINHSVTRYLREHMVKKWQTGSKMAIAGAIEIYAQDDLGFARISCYFCLTHFFHLRLCFEAGQFNGLCQRLQSWFMPVKLNLGIIQALLTDISCFFSAHLTLSLRAKPSQAEFVRQS
jgi:hypothetical protein